MGPAALIVCVCAVLLAVQSTDAALGSRCPPPNKVYFSKPVCRDDYDCKHGKICCLNPSRTKSCTEPAPYATGNDKYGGYDKYTTNKLGGNNKYAGYDKYKSNNPKANMKG